MENLWQAFKNTTVIIIAHRLSTIKNADEILLMQADKITEKGTHKQLLATKKGYYALLNYQLLGAE